MKKSLVAIALIAGGAGCASDMKAHMFDNAAGVHSGMTRQEVVKVMGARPDRIVDSGNGYVYAEHPDAPQTGRSVSIQFNSEGKTTGAPVIGKPQP